jgi:MarR family transcriptional regulator, temperature-dependent positive regulator of motility
LPATKVTGAKSHPRERALADEVRYELLRLIADNPQLSQRDVARHLGVSLGKANYCLKSIMHKGWVKATNFRNSRNKVAYMYLMTPRGIKEKAGVTLRFLQKRMQEYEALRVEIARIRAEANRRTG